MFQMKIISGHYGHVFHLDHNNRTIIPNNCVQERLLRNYYPVIAGGEVPFALPDLRFEDEMWAEYYRLLDVYWKEREKVKAEEYDRLMRRLRALLRYRPYWRVEHGGVLGITICLLFLPLMIATEIAYERKRDEAIEAWETFNNEQFIRDMMFIADKNSLRDALRSYDSQEGTNALHMMDATVKDMARLAEDLVNASDKYVIPSITKPRFATLEEIFSEEEKEVLEQYRESTYGEFSVTEFKLYLQGKGKELDDTVYLYTREPEGLGLQAKSEQLQICKDENLCEGFQIVQGNRLYPPFPPGK